MRERLSENMFSDSRVQSFVASLSSEKSIEIGRQVGGTRGAATLQLCPVY